MNRELLKMIIALNSLKQSMSDSPISSDAGKTIDMVETSQGIWERRTA